MNPSESTYRPHIAIVGKRNVGKSRFVNTLIGKQVSQVSHIAGTTKDPAINSFELLPYGPVLIVDTAGIDDEGELGSGKITQTIKTISSADLVILIVDSRDRLSSKERELIAYLDKIKVDFFIIANKIEYGVNEDLLRELKELRAVHFEVSCKEKVGFDEFKRRVIRRLPRADETFALSDIIKFSDDVLFVMPDHPADEESVLSSVYFGIIQNELNDRTQFTCCKISELQKFLKSKKNTPDMIITDSALVNVIKTMVEDKVKVSTFALILDRIKFDLPVLIKGLKSISKLKQGDKILFAEGCSDHPQNNCKFKIKEWLCSDSKRELKVEYINNGCLPDNLSEYKLLLHCDGCKLNRGDIRTRINEAILMDVPVVTYGVVSAYMNNVLPRALQPLKIKIHQ